MSAFLEMLLKWARSGDQNFRWIAWGYLLATRDLDPVDRLYAQHVIQARNQGISA